MGGHISIIQSDNIVDVILSDIPNYYNTFYDTLFDEISYSICFTKPTYQLVFDRLEIPTKEQGIIEDLLNIVYGVASLVVKPIKYLNDKKFCTHTYETSRIFRTPNGGMTASDNTVNNCDKILIYIANHVDSIEEPNEKRITREVTIGGHDYTIPSELWYTFNLNNGTSIYFYIHVSITQGYIGILLAVNREKLARLDIFKHVALNYYSQTMGHVGYGTINISDL